MPDVVKLVETCPACPEQYDVHFRGRLVGYLRLRYGVFRADYYDRELGKLTCYRAEPEGQGRFADNERGAYLTRACHAILQEVHPDTELKGLKYEFASLCRVVGEDINYTDDK